MADIKEEGSYYLFPLNVLYYDGIVDILLYPVVVSEGFK